MKNFPHQYNRLRTIRAALMTVRDLNEAGGQPGDDEELGYALARGHTYTFRGIDYERDDNAVAAAVEARIVEERAKPPSRQGARTAARETRRTLRYLGWIDGGYALTPAGEALLETAEGTDEELALVRQGIVGIEVVDADGNASHPVQILLRLIDEVDFRSRDGMQLALEAKDGSPDEFARIVDLAQLPVDERNETLKRLGWTDSQLANAVKILPAFAEQAGLMLRDAAGSFILTDAGRRAIGSVTPRPSPAAAAGTRGRRRRRRTSVRTRRRSSVGKARRLGRAARRAQTAEEQMAAAELLYERTERHQAVVRAVAAASREAEFYEDASSYDLLIDHDPNEPLELMEIKTISGDDSAQVRRGLGQLVYYEHMVVGKAFPNRSVRKTMVVDGPIDAELADFLEGQQIGLVELVEGRFEGRNRLGQWIVDEVLTA